MSKRKKVPYEPPRAYEIDWDGEGYVARCVSCLLECEARGDTPNKALRHLGQQGGCTIRHREMSLDARSRDCR